MRLGRALLLPLLTLVAAPDAAPPARRSPPVAAPNDNRAPAGSLRDGVLTLSLEATLATWHPDGESLPGIVIEAFAEPGRSPQVPGPLVRVPRGTEVRATVRNALADTLTFHLPAVTGSASDSVTIPPGATGELRARAAMPGTFLYRAVTRDPIARALRVGGLLAGAVVGVASSARSSSTSTRRASGRTPRPRMWCSCSRRHARAAWTERGCHATCPSRSRSTAAPTPTPSCCAPGTGTASG